MLWQSMQSRNKGQLFNGLWEDQDLRLGTSYFVSISALLYLGPGTYWHFFFKKKKRKNTLPPTKNTGRLKEKPALILVLPVEANLWVQRTNALNWHCLAIITKAHKRWIKMPSWKSCVL